MEAVPYVEKSPGIVQLWSVPAGFHRLATRDEVIEQGLNPDWADRNFGKIHGLFVEGKVHVVPDIFSDAEERILTRILRNSLSGRSDFQVWRLNSLNPTNLLYIYKYLSQNIPPEIPYIAGEIKSLLISKGYTTDYRESCERAVKAMAAKYDKSPNPDCQRCKDWDSMGLSNTCPSCDAQALAAIEDFKCEICRDIKFITVGEEDYTIQACKCNTKYKPLLSGWAD